MNADEQARRLRRAFEVEDSDIYRDRRRSTAFWCGLLVGLLGAICWTVLALLAVLAWGWAPWRWFG